MSEDIDATLSAEEFVDAPENEALMESKHQLAELQQRVEIDSGAVRARYAVGIGASAGGLDAIEQLFRNLEPDTGAAYIVVQHLSPDFKSLMNEILKRFVDLPIHRVQHGMVLEPNSIYLIPAKKNMIVSQGTLLLQDQVEDQGVQLPIDIFLRSLAQDYGPFAIGVILSGSGSDGSRGIREIHAKGGLVIVQDVNSAKFDGMPRAAISVGVADHVLPPDKIPDVIVHHLNSSIPFQPMLSPPPSPEEVALADIFDLLRLRFGIDFKYYRATTVDRRLERRMAMLHLHNLSAYATKLAEDPQELNKLYHDLLIGVTQFFRDPAAFQNLEDLVYPELFKQAAETRSIRVWVPGCATGEEAYSIAIGLAEYAKLHDHQGIDIKIFSTDVHRESLDSAAQGIYSRQFAENIPPLRLQTYFDKIGNEELRISNEIRRMVVFAPQNIISDPPFTKIDLISCRNLLIYLEPALQYKVISLFLFSLRIGGCLFLGPSETLGTLQDEFDVKSNRWNIFVKRRDRHLPQARPITSSTSMLSPVTRRRHSYADKSGPADDLTNFGYESLLADYVSTGFLLDERKQLVHIFGDASDLIRVKPGRPTTNILQLIIEELRVPLSTALHRATKEDSRIAYSGIQLPIPKYKDSSISLIVKPLYHSRSKSVYYFCCIEEAKEVERPTKVYSADQKPGTEQQIVDLETELQFTREHLQATNEELETSNEELQATNEELVAANEELQSTNEELQSTNEELQSTNEELHSVNEELHTVNSEYQMKIEELSQLTNDMENLLRCTQIGTIFLDVELQIRKFTPAMTSLMNLLDRDIGRPISHISSKIEASAEDLVQMARSVLETGNVLERELQTKRGEWMSMRILPYWDDSKTLAGVVCTFIDITQRRETEEELRHYTKELESANRDSQNFSCIASQDLLTPVRHIERITKNLRKEHDDQQLDLVLNQTQKMKMLINGLLEFSKVLGQGNQMERVEFSKALGEALHQLRLRIQEKKAEIDHALLPTLVADGPQITQLFYNLIDNSLKFCDKTPPKISISATHSEEDTWIFAVKDNGIGIPAESHMIVFDIFKQLNDREKYSGSGVGLTICKRIVERHKGRIWVESDGESGSTFYFSLPTRG
jgi:two-component system CheB/CheR fusion protein